MILQMLHFGAYREVLAVVRNRIKDVLLLFNFVRFYPPRRNRVW